MYDVTKKTVPKTQGHNSKGTFAIEQPTTRNNEVVVYC